MVWGHYKGLPFGFPFHNNEIGDLFKKIMELKRNDSKWNRMNFRLAEEDMLYTTEYFWDQEYVDRKIKVREEIRVKDEERLYNNFGKILLHLAPEKWEKAMFTAFVNKEEKTVQDFYCSYWIKIPNGELEEKKVVPEGKAFEQTHNNVIQFMSFTYSYSDFYVQWNKIEFKMTPDVQFEIFYLEV